MSKFLFSYVLKKAVGEALLRERRCARITSKDDTCVVVCGRSIPDGQDSCCAEHASSIGASLAGVSPVTRWLALSDGADELACVRCEERIKFGTGRRKQGACCGGGCGSWIHYRCARDLLMPKAASEAPYPVPRCHRCHETGSAGSLKNMRDFFRTLRGPCSYKDFAAAAERRPADQHAAVSTPSSARPSHGSSEGSPDDASAAPVSDVPSEFGSNGGGASPPPSPRRSRGGSPAAVSRDRRRSPSPAAARRGRTRDRSPAAAARGHSSGHASAAAERNTRPPVAAARERVHQRSAAARSEGNRTARPAPASGRSRARRASPTRCSSPVAVGLDSDADSQPRRRPRLARADPADPTRHLSFAAASSGEHLPSRWLEQPFSNIQFPSASRGQPSRRPADGQASADAPLLPSPPAAGGTAVSISPPSALVGGGYWLRVDSSFVDSLPSISSEHMVSAVAAALSALHSHIPPRESPAFPVDLPEFNELLSRCCRGVSFDRNLSTSALANMLASDWSHSDLVTPLSRFAFSMFSRHDHLTRQGAPAGHVAAVQLLMLFCVHFLTLFNVFRPRSKTAAACYAILVLQELHFNRRVPASSLREISEEAALLAPRPLAGGGRSGASANSGPRLTSGNGGGSHSGAPASRSTV